MHQKQGLFLSVYVDNKKWLESQSDVEEIDELRTTKDTDFEKVKTLFDIFQKLILNQSEKIFGMSTIHWNTIPWMKTT